MDVDEKAGGEHEPAVESPEMRAFNELIDREGHRRQDEMRRRSTPPSRAGSQAAWQPSFRMEDFECVPGIDGGHSKKLTDKSMTVVIREEQEGWVEEEEEKKRVRKGLKRTRDLSSHGVGGDGKVDKKRATRVPLKLDLNKREEWLDDNSFS